MEAITKTISRSFAPKKEDISDEEQMAEPVHALSSDIAQTPPSQTRRRRQRWNANPGLCLETIRLSGAIVSGFEDEREHLLDNITRQAGEIERLKGNLATAKQQRDRLRWISVMDVVKAARLNRDLEAVKAGQAQEVTVRNEAVTELGRQRDELLSRFTLQALEIEFLNEKAALLGDQLNYQLDPTSKRHANEFIQRDGNRETHRGVTELERERAHLLAKVTRLSRELEEVKSQATRGSQEISRLKLKVAVLINERDNVQTQGSYQAQEISNLIGLTALLEQQRCSQQVEVNQQALQIMELENERRGLLTNITRQETNISSLKQQVASLRHGRTSLTQQVAALRHGRTSQHKQVAPFLVKQCCQSLIPWFVDTKFGFRAITSQFCRCMEAGCSGTHTGQRAIRNGQEEAGGTSLVGHGGGYRRCRSRCRPEISPPPRTASANACIAGRPGKPTASGIHCRRIPLAGHRIRHCYRHFHYGCRRCLDLRLLPATSPP